MLLIAFVLWPLAGHAELELVPDKESQEPQRVFAGEGRRITVLFHNPGGNPANADLRTRLYQASSATVMLLGEAPWKKLEVLPGQTVVESVTMTFPVVKADTRFLVEWVEGTNRVAGTTEVLVYPPDLLKELKPLAGEEPLGAFDPQNRFKPLLKGARVEFQDLEDAGLQDYHGKLAVVGPFQTQAQMRESLANRSVKALAEKGVAVVWIQPPPELKPRGVESPKPSFYTVTEGKGAVVVVQAKLVAGLADDPQAQLNLIQFARLARYPEPLRLPHLTPSP